MAIWSRFSDFKYPILLSIFIFGSVGGSGGSSGYPQENSQPPKVFPVTTTADGGEGSLRQAILDANARPGADIVTFDAEVGPFSTPHTIFLTEPLPELTGELTIDGYISGKLWQATGVTVSGGNRFPVFLVAPDSRVTIASMTVAEGRAKNGGGIENRGELVIRGVTFLDNRASRRGGGVANLGGKVTVINSTFSGNRAGKGGGGLANIRGDLTVTNCTFSANSAGKGGGLFSRGALLLRNTIVANSVEGEDCVVSSDSSFTGVHNLIETHRGCGDPISTADPRLGDLGSYQGSTPTIPLKGGSPAINLGDNDSAVDEAGRPLKWDQRGNGDPRYVAGFTDIGAFEVQAFPWLTVDTYEDSDLRACTRSRTGDCPLRGAIHLANATPKADVIRFDPEVFDRPRTILLESPLPDLATDMTLDGSGTAGIILKGNGSFSPYWILPGVDVQLIEVRIDAGFSPANGRNGNGHPIP